MAKPSDKPRELTNLVIEEVSLVGLPANRRKFLLTKSVGDDMAGEKKTFEVDGALIPVFEFLGDANKGKDLVAKCVEITKAAGLSPEELAKVQSAMKLLDDCKAKLPESVMSGLMDAAGLKTAKAVEPPKPEPVVKGLPVKDDGSLDLDKIPEAFRGTAEVLYKSVRANAERVEKAERAAKEANEMLRTERITKSVGTFAKAPGSTEDKVAIIKALEDGGHKELVPKFEAVMKSAHELLSDPKKLVEIGSAAEGASGEAGIAKAIEAKVKERIQKSVDAGKPIDKGTAWAAVMAENPSLYEQYEREGGRLR